MKRPAAAPPIPICQTQLIFVIMIFGGDCFILSPPHNGPMAQNFKKERKITMDVSQFCLEGKTALATGGSRGIGEATAAGFARAGADVALASRKISNLERVASGQLLEDHRGNLRHV